MIFGEFYSNYLKCIIVQVNKKNAEKLFNAGKHVFFKANKMRFDNALESPCEIDNMDGRWNTTIGITAFQNACNHFSNFNCDNYRGKRIQFFVRKSDFE